MEKEITISLIDLIENNPPSDILLSNLTIKEGLPPGTVIGNLNTVDIDENDEYTYALVEGTGPADSNSFTISGNELRSAKIFDYETGKEYFIRISSKDNFGKTIEKSFLIKIVDVTENNAPVAIQLSSPPNFPFGNSRFVLWQTKRTLKS
jgi:hypothetical protein